MATDAGHPIIPGNSRRAATPPRRNQMDDEVTSALVPDVGEGMWVWERGCGHGWDHRRK